MQWNKQEDGFACCEEQEEVTEAKKEDMPDNRSHQRNKN